MQKNVVNKSCREFIRFKSIIAEVKNPTTLTVWNQKLINLSREKISDFEDVEEGFLNELV